MALGKHEIATVQTTAIDKAGLIRLTTVLAHSSGSGSIRLAGMPGYGFKRAKVDRVIARLRKDCDRDFPAWWCCSARIARC